MSGEPAAGKQSVSLSSVKMPAEVPCTMCKKVCVCKKCSKCSNCWYCSRDCQVKDWRTHKQVCPIVQEMRSWSSFLEYLGGQFSREDDQDYAECKSDLSSLPILPHVVLGTLEIGAKPGQVALATCPFTRERAVSLPIHICSGDRLSVETDVAVICATLHTFLNGYTLDEAVRDCLPVAIRRCYLDGVGFKLPSVLQLSSMARSSYIYTPPRK